LAALIVTAYLQRPLWFSKPGPFPLSKSFFQVRGLANLVRVVPVLQLRANLVCQSFQRSIELSRDTPKLLNVCVSEWFFM